MLFILRKIRRKLMSKNKFTTYLLYALGEIILVVIGILIALSLNNWNQSNQKRALEKSYLKEIKGSLEVDSMAIDAITGVNNEILQHIDSLLTKMQNRNYEQMKYAVLPHIQPLFNYSVFRPKRIAFDNMVSAESISLISNSALHESLSQYYGEESDVQERIKLITRDFIDNMTPMLMSGQLLKRSTGYDLPVKKLEQAKINEDPYMISRLLSRRELTTFQNKWVDSQKTEASHIMRIIDQELENQ